MGLRLPVVRRKSPIPIRSDSDEIGILFLRCLTQRERIKSGQPAVSNHEMPTLERRQRIMQEVCKMADRFVLE